MTAATSQKLATALHDAGLHQLARRAEADEFHDFLSPHATPELLLAAVLAEIAIDTRHLKKTRIAAHSIRQRLIDGEFDASLEESDEWAASAEGQDAFRRLAEGK